MILANCGELGLDWERITLGEYFEALEAHNEAAPGEKPEPDLDRLRKFKEARGSTH